MAKLLVPINQLIAHCPQPQRLLGLMILWVICFNAAGATNRLTIKALYIPLADHYASIVAYERYRSQMIHADFKLEQMKNWDLLRANFQDGNADMAFVMSPLAMDMFQQKPEFRWIGLMHRDGGAMAINNLLNAQIQLAPLRADRKPDKSLAKALTTNYLIRGRPTEIGLPHLLSTHSVVLYHYLEQQGVSLALKPNRRAPVLLIPIPPPKSLAFIKGRSNRAQPAAFGQSLPWADVVETGGFGHVAWYSKDVLPWPEGHVECIVLAQDQSIAEKFSATQEVMKFIQQAGRDIEIARTTGGRALGEIIDLIRQHIPAHTSDAIQASLDNDLRVINYNYLNIDKGGLKQVMDLAVKGGFLNRAIDINSFSDARFGTKLGQKPPDSPSARNNKQNPAAGTEVNTRGS